MLKPGGILIIDHRNYDYILKNGKAPKKNIYYNSQNIKSIKTQIIYEDNKPRQIVLDYKMDVEGDGDFVLSYQPWTLAEFSSLLKVMPYLVKLFHPLKNLYFPTQNHIPGNLRQRRRPHHLRRLLQALRGGRPRLLHPRHREARFHQAVVDPFDFGLVFCDAAHRAVFHFRLNCANSAANLPTAWPFPTLDQCGQNIVTTRKFKNVNQINHVLSHIRWKLEQIKISFLSCILVKIARIELSVTAEGIEKEFDLHLPILSN